LSLDLAWYLTPLDDAPNNHGSMAPRLRAAAAPSGRLGGQQLLLRLLPAAGLLAARAAQPAVPAASPLVAWSGRYAVLADNASVACDWASAAATLAVDGGAAGDATLTVRTAATFAPRLAGRLVVFINGFEATNVLVPAGPQAFLVAAALPANVTSNVTIVYSMEQVLSGASPTQFMVFAGFDVGGGGSLAAPPRQLRRLDVIGDSITAGASYDRMESVRGAFSLGGGCAPWCPLYGYSQTGAWETYVARFFDANISTTAWSGKGLIHNSGCNAGPTMPQLYTTTFGANPEAAPWDFSRSSRPDAVIVFLGTNDFSCNETTDAAFTAALVEFFHNVTAHYAAAAPPPSGRAATVFVPALGPMSPTKPLAAIRAAVAQALAEGLQAALLDMTNATLDGCGGHPGPYGHMQMAAQAAPQLQAILGW